MLAICVSICGMVSAESDEERSGRIASRRGPDPPLSDAGSPLGLPLWGVFLRKLKEARVGLIGHFG